MRRQGIIKVQRALAILLCSALVCGCFAVQAAGIDAVAVSAAPLSSDNITMNGMVRVYLASLGNLSELDLTICGNYSLSTTGQFLSNGTNVKVRFNAANGQITISYGGTTVQAGQSASFRRHSAHGENGIKIWQTRDSANPYPGDLSLEAVYGSNGYTLYTIVHVYIEDYLYGVLPYEMGNSSNIEALKAQAVAARTYTVRMMKSRSTGRYDVKDTTSDQSYRGTPSGNANCKAAVDATKGIVLMYGSSYITTYYSSSNGGQTETSRSGAAYAYMKVKDDPFDYANPSSTVKKKTIYTDLQSGANNAQLIALLKSKAITRLQQAGYAATYDNTILYTLKGVTPHTPKYAAPSRLYTKIDFTFSLATRTANGQTANVTQTVTCDIFSELEGMLSMGIQSSANELWSVSQNGNSFVLQARRYGHGMGMSQRGAMYMAQLGYRYDQILGFYYDGCKRVQHSFTSSILAGSSSDQQVTVQPPADLEADDPNACRGTIRLSGASTVLAIRASKSAEGAMLGTAGNGAIVDVLSNDGNWCQIRFGDIVGYVPSSAVVFSGTPAGIESSVSNILGFVTVTAKDFVNLRASGNMNAKVLGTAPAGAVLTVFSRSGSWAKVQYNALSAYVNTGFVSNVSSVYPSGNQVSQGTQTAWISVENGLVNLRMSPSMDAGVVTQLAAGTEVTVLSNDGSWAQIQCLGMTGYVLSVYLADNGMNVPSAPEEDENENTPDQSVRAIVATEYGSLNMRMEAYAGSQILTTIPKGMEIEVVQRNDLWSAVRFDGYEGYVMTSYLLFVDQGTTDVLPEGTDTATVSTPGGTLNLRVQPRAGSDIIFQIPQGAGVRVTQYGAEWCNVIYQGMNGYVMTVFLSFDKLPEEENSGTTAPSGQAVVSTASGSLNLRMQASLYAETLLQIPQYAVVTVLEKNGDWCRVQYQGIEGFVMSSFLQFTGAGTQDTPSIEQTPAEPSVPETNNTETAYVSTESGTLNLRAEPNGQAEVLTTIPQNAAVSVLNYGDSWCAIAYNGLQGYVMTNFLSFGRPLDKVPSYPETPDSGEPDISNAAVAWVNTQSGSLNLREQPQAFARVIISIPRGREVLLLSEGNDWSYVAYNGCFGYVMTRYLSVTALSGNGFDSTMPEEDGGWMATPAPPAVSNGLDLTLQAPDRATFAVISSDMAWLWPSCAEEGAALGNAARGEQVEIILIGQTWSLVQYGSLQGYCRMECLNIQ